MECPKCKTENPARCATCECGYAFASSRASRSEPAGDAVQARPTVPGWKHVACFFLDFVLAFLAIGGGIATLTGGWTSNGFQLEGLPALAALVLVIAYFKVGNRLGGTVGKRLLGIPVGPAT